MQVRSISEAGFVPGYQDIKLIWGLDSRERSSPTTTPGCFITSQHTPGMLIASALALGVQPPAISLPESHFLNITILREWLVPDS